MKVVEPGTRQHAQTVGHLREASALAAQLDRSPPTTEQRIAAETLLAPTIQQTPQARLPL